MSAYEDFFKYLKNGLSDVQNDLYVSGNISDELNDIHNLIIEQIEDIDRPLEKKHFAFNNVHELAETGGKYLLEIQEVVGSIKELSLELILHLKKNPKDITKIDPIVFEHLIAEFFASWGEFDDVRLVGTDPRTAADIFALKKLDKSGVPFRMMIEVKRQKDRCGVEVIDRVIGAITSEKLNHGWNVGMVVSASGFKNFKKFNKQKLSYLGLELRDKESVQNWLCEYRLSDKGLYLPSPLRKMPDHN